MKVLEQLRIQQEQQEQAFRKKMEKESIVKIEIDELLENKQQLQSLENQTPKGLNDDQVRFLISE